MSNSYRAWGPLEWVLSKLNVSDWSFIGVHGTEDRCAATIDSLKGCNLVQKKIYKINDPDPVPIDAFISRFEATRQLLYAAGVAPTEIDEAPLITTIDFIRDQVRSLNGRGEKSVIIDISSMPKWWFYPTIRFLLQDNSISNILVTYASAVAYGEELSSDPLPLSSLPSFGDLEGRTNHQELIVGIGFAPLGLKDLYSDKVERVRYLFPFPPGPPFFFRNWQFLRGLSTEIENRNLRLDDRWHIHMYDAPSIFDAISNFTDNGNRTSALAPFGPKPMSLAMCLFALAAERANKSTVPVFYTQPQKYDVNYSTGIKKINGTNDIQAYCIKLDGRMLYSLQP